MKTPKPRKLPSGSWHIQLRLGGESIPITAATPTEATQQAELIKAEYRSGRRSTCLAPRDLTLRMCMENYIKRYTAVLSPATVRGYEQMKDNRFPAYMDKPIRSIDFQRMINDELKIRSEKTVQNAWFFTHACLKYAGVPIPDVRLAQVPVNEIPFLQPEEVLPFCEAVKGRSYEIPALIELHGLRLSEVLALTWDKVDLKAGTITVLGARVRGPAGFVDKRTNKNRTSTRVVPIMIPQLTDALKAVEDKTGRVCSITSGVLLEDVKRSCKRAGITVVGNHGLRHSFASLCYHLGINERQLMSWGGWSDYTTMHRIYIRLARSDESKARSAVSAFFA